MATLGMPEILVVLFMLVVYGIIFWIVWKFYTVLANMNENLNGIRRALEHGGDQRQEPSSQ